MLARRPFVVMGGRHHLASLRQLGFHTFGEFWDEGYDDHGMQHRVHEILKVIDVISQWSTDRVHQTLLDMQPTLEHNYNVFMALTHNKISKTFRE